MRPNRPAIRPFGIWAGNGAYPNLLKESIVCSGSKVVVAGILDHFETIPSNGCVCIEQFPLGSVGKTARFFNAHGASHIFFAGGIDRSKALSTLRPDRHSIPLVLKALFKGDNHLLTVVADQMARLGPRVCDPRAFLKETLADDGLMAGPPLDDAAFEDLRRARRAAEDIGRRDRGQAALASRGQVIGLESRRGTDALIAIATRGSVLAKVAKPGQDMRFDLPTIGPNTIENAKDAGIRAIGVASKEVLLIEKSQVLQMCNEYALSLWGFTLDR